MDQTPYVLFCGRVRRLQRAAAAFCVLLLFVNILAPFAAYADTASATGQSGSSVGTSGSLSSASAGGASSVSKSSAPVTAEGAAFQAAIDREVASGQLRPQGFTYPSSEAAAKAAAADNTSGAGSGASGSQSSTAANGGAAGASDASSGATSGSTAGSSPSSSGTSGSTARVTGGGATPMSSGGVPTDPTYVAPSTITNIHSNATVDNKTGGFQYSFPIDVPAGRNGLTPSLELDYSSQSDTYDSVMGQGWSVNIPTIQRVNKYGSDVLYATSSATTTFTSSISGELLPTATSTVYAAKVETGSFVTYVYSGNTWTATDKSGTVYTYGTSTASRLDNASSTSQINTWMLDKVTDTNGNTIVYDYTKDGGQIYPHSISYVNQSGGSALYSIQFSTINATGTPISYRRAFGVSTNKLINQISVLTNGVTTKTYSLGYHQASASKVYLLDSIQPSAVDGNGVNTTLASTTFAYSENMGSGTLSGSATSSWSTSIKNDFEIDYSYYPSGFASFYPRDTLIDLNGDGLPDWFDNGTAYMNTGSAWSASSTWTGIPYTTEDDGYRFADVNGDGLPDIVYSTATDYYPGTGTNSSSTAVYINNGDGTWTNSPSWANTIPGPFNLTVYNSSLVPTTYTENTYVVDMNGDGLPDFVVNGTVYLNNGHGWQATSSWPTLPYSSFDQAYRLVDVNGDGLPDIVHSESTYFYGTYTYTKEVFLNKGDGTWQSSPTIASTIPTSLMFTNLNTGLTYYPSANIQDLNGDGLADWIANGSAYLNTGNGWEATSTWNGLPISTNNNFRIADVNGDNMPDIVLAYRQRWDPRFGSSDVVNEVVYLNQEKPLWLMSDVTNSQGGKVDVSYTTSATPVSGTLLNPKTPYDLNVVKNVTYTDPVKSQQHVVSYQYENGSNYYQASDVYNREFAGFGKVTVSDAAEKVKTYYHQANGNDSGSYESGDSVPLIGFPYRTETTDSNDALYSVDIQNWNTADLGSGSTYASLASDITLDYDGLSTHQDKGTLYSYATTTGNLLTKTELGAITAGLNGSYTDITGDKRVTTYSYAASTTAHILGLVSDQTVTNESGTKLAETKQYYDSSSVLGFVSKGNNTETDNWITGTSFSTSSMAYSSYGLPTQKTDPRGNATNLSYDSYNLYVATSTNPLGQTTSYLYNYGVGKAKQTTDPNGLVTQTDYDGFGRPEAERQPDQTTPSTLVTKTAYSYGDTPLSIYVHTTNYLDASNTTSDYVYADGFGRPIQERTSAEGGLYSTKDTAYDSRGLKYDESLPYFSSGSALTTATTTTSLFSYYLYDPIQRLATTTNAVGTTVNVYDNWKTLTFDPRGKEKDTYKDAYGNLSQVDEHNGTSTYSTYYTYDGLQDLTKITDALGNVRDFTYDGLGRRLKAEDLHASGDTTFGSTTFAYDNAGNMTQKVDAKNQTVNYTYDAINRPLTEDYTGLAGTEVSYRYDSCAYGIGHLCIATSTGAVASYTYSPLGLASQESKKIGSNTYVTTTTYDRQGNTVSVTYPDSSQVTYTYNAAGLPHSVSRNESGGSSVNVITSIGYSPTGEMSTIQYANGVNTTNTFDPAHLYRLSGKLTTNASSTNLQNIGYSYDADGNITTLNDTSATDAAKLASYVYDDLNRLISATVYASSSSASSSGSWYSPSWQYRIPITASTTKVLEDTHDIYFNFSIMPSQFFTNSQSNGCDVRVTKSDGVTELPIDLVSFSSASSTGQLHFSTGGALSTTATSTYYVYYGNPSASCYASTATYGAQNVYDSNTKAVWHMEQNTAAVGGIRDSTANGHNGTMYSNYNPQANGVSGGIVGNAADFNGTNDSIDVPSSTDFTSSAGTVEAWIYMNQLPSQTGQNEDVVAKKNATSPYSSFALYIGNPDNRTDGSWTDNTGTTAYAGTYAGTTTASAWHYVVLREDPTASPNNLAVRTDASSANTYTAGTNGTTYSSNDVLRIGADYDGGSLFNGAIDEVRFHSAVLDDNYLQTRYNDMTSPWTFWSAGPIVASSSVISATSSGASGYTQAFTYDALGNITSGPVGSYSYAGNTGSSYADPDAATTIGGATLSYDNNGNMLTSSGTGGMTNTWDYRNQLAQTVIGAATTSYAYDQDGDRVSLTDALGTTYYPNRYYDASSATSTRQVYANGELVATLNGTGSSTAAYYVSTDHLDGSAVVTNASGTPVEVTDYYPYGSIRLDERSGSFNEQRKYIGQVFDVDTGLNYLNARYYASAVGDFTSQDPVFLGMGSLGRDQGTFLQDPQQMNAYSYAKDNPIVNSDPSGKCLEDGCVGEAISIGAMVGFVGGVGSQYLGDVDSNISKNGLSFGDFFLGLSSPKEYAISATKGTTVGAAAVGASVLELGAALVGVTAGTFTAVTDYIGNKFSDQKMSNGDIAKDGLFNTVTGGVLELLPAVRGKLPKGISEAFFTGSHALNAFAQEAASVSLESVFMNAMTMISPNTQVTSSGTSYSQRQQTAVYARSNK